jgi:hypothetical protein
MAVLCESKKKEIGCSLNTNVKIDHKRDEKPLHLSPRVSESIMKRCRKKNQFLSPLSVSEESFIGSCIEN